MPSTDAQKQSALGGSETGFTLEERLKRIESFDPTAEIERLRQEDKPPVRFKLPPIPAYDEPGEAGLPSHTLMAPDVAKRAFHVAEETRDTQGEVEAMRALTGDPRIMDAEEIERELEPDWFEQITRIFDPFVNPQRALWYGVERAGELLPDPGTPVGDALQWAAGKTLGAGLYHTLDVQGVGGIKADLPKSFIQMPEVPDPIEKMMGNLYDAVATGKLAERAEENPARLFWGLGPDSEIDPWVTPEKGAWAGFTSGELPGPKGIHIIDAMIGEREAAQLASTATDPIVREFAEKMATPWQREAYGMAAEIILDPLWFAGPAKGARTVHDAGKAYTVASPLVRAAASARRAGEGMSEARLLQGLVKIASGAEDAEGALNTFATLSRSAEASARAASTQLAMTTEAVASGDLVAGAQRVLRSKAASLQRRAEELRATDQAMHTRFAGRATDLLKTAEQMTPEAAGKMLSFQEKALAKDVRYWERVADNIRSGVAHAQAGEHVVGKGSFAVHVPFGKATRYVVPAGKTKAVAQKVVAKSQLLRDVSAMAKLHSPDGVAQALKMVDGDATQLMPSQRWAMGWHDTLGKAALVPARVLHGLNLAFGTRFVQPLVTKITLEGELARKAKLSPWSQRFTEFVRRVDPEVWDAYQESVSGFYRTMQANQGRLDAAMLRLERVAEQVVKQRKGRWREEVSRLEGELANATSDLHRARIREAIEEARSWGRSDYGVENVMNMAGHYREAGAGLLQEAHNKDLVPFAGEVENLVREYIEVAGEHPQVVMNTLAQLARSGVMDRGRLDAMTELITDLAALQPAGSSWGRTLLLRRAADQRAAQVDAVRRVVRDLSVEGLADLVLAAGEGPWSPALAQHIDAALAQLVKDPADRARVLQDVALLMGTKEPYRAVRELAGLLREASPLDLVKAGRNRSAGQAMRAAVGNWLRRLSNEELELRKLWKKLPKPDDKGLPQFLGRDLPDLPDPLLASLRDRSMAQARALVGDPEWEDFLTWFHGGAGAAEKEAWVKAATPFGHGLLLDAVLRGDLAAPVGRKILGTQRPAVRGQILANLRKQREAGAKVSFDAATLLAAKLDGLADLPEEQLLDGVNTALLGMIPSDSPTLRLWVDKMVVEVVKRIKESKDPSRVLRQLKRQLGKDLGGLSSVLREMGEDVVPAIPLNKPGEPEFAREIQAWELQMWDRFEAITAGLDRRQKLLLAFSALRESPNILSPDEIARVTAMYPDVMGHRLRQAPEDLKPVLDELGRLVDQYEKLYTEHGLDFAKNPIAMLEAWGVVDYVPHLMTEEALIAKGQVGAAGSLVPDISKGGMEAMIDTRTGARRKREMTGTILEINAVANSAQFTLDPAAVMSRFRQVNRAIANHEMLYGLLRGGVIRAINPGDFSDRVSWVGGLDGRTQRTVAEVAAELDYVPLFGRRNKVVDQDVLVLGDADTWARNGVTLEMVDEAIAGLRDEGPFATWLRDVPEVQAMRNIELSVLGIRRDQAQAGEQLVNPMRMFQDRVRALEAQGVEQGEAIGKAWGEVADELLDLRRRFDTDLPKFTARELEHYFDPRNPGWNLYAPRAVVQSMQDLFYVPEAGTFKKALDALNVWWKTRVTVTSIAFSARNALDNHMARIMDEGPFGVLNPRTHIQAGQITAAQMLRDEYGSIARAAEYFEHGLPPELKTLGGRMRYRLAKAAWEGGGLPWSLKSMADKGVDLGDGLLRSLDETIIALEDAGVLSPTGVAWQDIVASEHELMAAVERQVGKKVARTVSAFEDVATVAISSAMTGGIPVALPKKLGAALSRVVENQSRVSNFLGNFRRTGSFDDAARHVEQFLFNYGDLTALQKGWGRTLWTFMTWNLKNLQRHADLMQRSPVLYSQFVHTLMEGIPRTFEATHTPKGEHYAQDYENPTLLEPHLLNTIRLPFPTLDNTFLAGTKLASMFPKLEQAEIRGLGLRQEALAEKIGLILGGLKDAKRRVFDSSSPRQWESRNRMTRFLGETHFLARYFAEAFLTEQHSYYDRPIGELNNGRLVAQVLAALPDGDFKSTLARMLKLYVYEDVPNKKTGEQVDVPTIYGQPNHLFASIPYARNWRDAAALTNVNAVSNAQQPGVWAEGALEEVPKGWLWMDALTGIKVHQQDPEFAARMHELDVQEVRRKMLAQPKQLKEYGVNYVPTRDVSR